MNMKDLQITLEDFKLIKAFYPDFQRKQGIQTNNIIIGWSELMPVVERIESIPIPNDTTTYNFQIHKIFTKIWEPFENHNPLIYNSGNTKIESVHKSVIDFIKGHNS